LWKPRSILYTREWRAVSVDLPLRANLTERLLLKSQIRIIFNVQPVNQESGSAIRELQRTI